MFIRAVIPSVTKLPDCLRKEQVILLKSYCLPKKPFWWKHVRSIRCIDFGMCAMPFSKKKKKNFSEDHSHFSSRGIETLKTKSLFSQATLKRPPVIVISKSVPTPTIIITMPFMNQNSANKIWARSPKDYFLKKTTCLTVAKNISRIKAPLEAPTISCCFLTDKDFNNFFMSVYCASSPYSPEPCFWMDQNFANNFWKGSPKEHLFNYLKI